MKNRLSRAVMVLATIAIAVSMVAALTPDASAQDSGPAVKDVEAAANANFISQQKTCCITVSPLYPVYPGTTISSESPGCETPFCCPSRWFCMERYQNGNNHQY